jgi:ribokinase
LNFLCFIRVDSCEFVSIRDPHFIDPKWNFSCVHPFPIRGKTKFMSQSKSIVVIGSINMDLVCRAPRFPAGGETILGTDFHMIPGGKGANQSVAAARMGAKGTAVHHVGRVGADDLGQRLVHQMKSFGVDVRHVTITEGVSSGVAMILVETGGENRIVVAPGANAKLSRADIDRAEPLIREAGVVVMQLEIPLPIVRYAITMCRRHGVFTILDPAPAPQDAPPHVIFGVDLLTPNQGEAKQLLGVPGRAKVKRKPVVDPKQIAMDLHARGVKNVVLKLGARGALSVSEHGRIERHAGFKVRVVDTTAAGDVFTAALAIAHVEGMTLAESVHFANAAGALCCTKFGAQPALPDREEVERLMSR